jgi:hypothetical protein
LDRLASITSVRNAVILLKAAVANNPDGIAPSYGSADADAAIAGSDGQTTTARDTADTARADISALTRSADAWLNRARDLAATVAAC